MPNYNKKVLGGMNIMNLNTPNRNKRSYSIETYNKLMENIKIPFTNKESVENIIPSSQAIYNRFSEEEIENMLHEKISKEIKEALLSSVPTSTSPSEERFTLEEINEYLKRVKDELDKVQNSLDFNFKGDILNVENLTSIIKFIKANKPGFEFQIVLKATGDIKGVKKILDVDIFDAGDYVMDGQIYIIPKESPKYFTVKFE